MSADILDTLRISSVWSPEMLAAAIEEIASLRSRLVEAERDRDRRAEVLEEALKQIGEILSAVSMPNRDAIVARLQVIAIIERTLGEKL